MTFPRLRFFAIEGQLFGLALKIESCGCKHLDIGFGIFVLRIDFGICRELRM